VGTLGPISLSNRDLATGYWLVIFGAWVLAKPDVAGGLWRAITTARIFFAPLLLYVGWVIALVMAGRAAGVWELSLLKDTIAYFVVAWVGMFFSFGEASSEVRWFGRTLVRTIWLTAILEFYLNLAVFDLWIELLLQPIPLFASIMFDGEVPGLLGDPRRVGVRGDARQLHSPGREFDQEQDVDGLQPDRLDGEEVGREDPRRL
jgi:hypothetical protein